MFWVTRPELSCKPGKLCALIANIVQGSRNGGLYDMNHIVCDKEPVSLVTILDC